MTAIALPTSADLLRRVVREHPELLEVQLGEPKLDFDIGIICLSLMRETLNLWEGTRDTMDGDFRIWIDLDETGLPFELKAVPGMAWGFTVVHTVRAFVQAALMGRKFFFVPDKEELAALTDLGDYISISLCIEGPPIPGLRVADPFGRVTWEVLIDHASPPAAAILAAIGHGERMEEINRKVGQKAALATSDPGAERAAAEEELQRALQAAGLA